VSIAGFACVVVTIPSLYRAEAGVAARVD